MSRVPYTSALGSLMYAMLCTIPDICFAVGLVSRYQSDAGPTHWKAVKRIMRYLNGTSDYTLCYQGNDLHLKGYTDADYGGDLDDNNLPRDMSSCSALLLYHGVVRSNHVLPYPRWRLSLWPLDSSARSC